MFKNLLKNDEAVSPIVATLVLIVVAIIGAAAVGLIMGTFSQNVADETNTGDIASGASGEIMIAGSTTVQPASELMAKAFMDTHKGVKITVYGGGSGAGILGAVEKRIDIGSSSSAVGDDVLARNPELEVYEIGGSAVAIITNDATMLDITKDNLKALYDVDAVTTSTVAFDNVYERAESSGTEETFAGYLDLQTGSDKQLPGNGTGMNGNAGVLNAVKGTASGKRSIGFVDWGYVKDPIAGVKVLNITDGTTTYTTNATNIKSALKGEKTYPAKLVKHLYYIVNGEPNTVVKSYLDFAKSPGAQKYFNDAGMFSIYEYTNA